MRIGMPGFAAIAAAVAAATLLSGHHAYAKDGVNAQARQHERRIVESPIEEDPESVLEFWSDARMDDAWNGSTGFPGSPVEAPPLLPGADSSGYITMPIPYADHRLSRMTGILFYRERVGDRYALANCSASVVTSHSKSLIVTAAHCVEFRGAWRDKMLFVPAYDGTASDGRRAPLGKWPVRQAFIPYEHAGATTGDDVAVARLYPERPPIGPGLPVEIRTGGGLVPLTSESGDLARVKILGYPNLWRAGDPPYRGEQRRCDSPARADTQTTALTAPYCAAQNGNSGGPLVVEPGDALPPEVVGVVHNTATHARLKRSTFGAIYNAADD